MSERGIEDVRVTVNGAVIPEIKTEIVIGIEAASGAKINMTTASGTTGTNPTSTHSHKAPFNFNVFL